MVKFCHCFVCIYSIVHSMYVCDHIHTYMHNYTQGGEKGREREREIDGEERVGGRVGEETRLSPQSNNQVNFCMSRITVFPWFCFAETRSAWHVI